MFARIARQYRRFLFGSAVLLTIVALSTTLGLAEWPVLEHGVLITVLTWIILLLLVIGVPIILFSILLPGLLPLIEIWGIAVLLSAGIDPVYRILMNAAHLPGWAYCFYLMTLFIIVERALYGPWLANFMRRDMRKQTATFVTRGTPEMLWHALAPDPEHAEHYYWPKARFMPPPRGSAADFVLNLPRRGGYKDALLEIHIEESTPYSSLRYRAEPMLGSADPAQIIEIEIRPLEDQRCQIRYSMQYLSVPLGKRLFYFLSHEFRDTLASLRAHLSGRRDRSLQGSQMLPA